LGRLAGFGILGIFGISKGPVTTDQTHAALEAAVRLRSALEATAEALAAPDLSALLASEAAVETALAELPPLDRLEPAQRASVRAELDRARGALLRCRRLGSALGDFIRVSFEAQGRGSGYGRPDLTFAGYTFNERV
jgi:hypothetical protein